MQFRRYLYYFLVIVPYIVFSPLWLSFPFKAFHSSKKILAQKIQAQYHSKLTTSETFFILSHPNTNIQKKKIKGNYPWPGCHRHCVNCPSPLGGRVYTPAEGACPTILGKNQQICGNSQQSCSCFALLLEPCCFP